MSIRTVTTRLGCVYDIVNIEMMIMFRLSYTYEEI